MGTANRPAKRGRPAIGLILGAILVPAAAAASVAILTNTTDAEAEPAGTLATVAESTTTVATEAPTETVTTVVSVVADPVEATEDHLEQACTVDGPALVAAEADGTASPLQLAALDALRQVCDEEGMPLDGPPEPPPIIETITVRSDSTSSSDATPPAGTSAPGDDEYDEYEHDDDEYEGHEQEAEFEDHEREDGAQAVGNWESVRDDAGDAVAAALDAAPDSELTREAVEKLSEADRAARKGEWGDAIEKASEALRYANRALGSV